MSATSPNTDPRATHKRRNLVHTWLMVTGSLSLLALCAYIFAGPFGVVWAALLGGMSLYMSTRVTPAMILKLYKTRPLEADEFPEIHRIVARLARRAGLPKVPEIHHVRGQMMNAFAVGRPDGAVIVMTDSLLRGLSLRELAGVIAHEISHLRNEDVRVMALADVVSRMTSIMATIGMITLFFHLPAIADNPDAVPWAGIAILMAAPTIGTLLQLGLSRAREYDADLDAAWLSGDAHGLASALIRLDRHQGRMWEKMALPGSRAPQTSVLRSHPRTEDRVARLMAFHPDRAPVTADDDDGAESGTAMPPHSPVPLVPRTRWAR